MQMPQTRRRLRKREVLFAVAAGALAAGGAALVLEISEDSGAVPVAAAQESDQTYEVAEFDHISTVGPQDVAVTFGETFSVRSEGSAEALGQLEVVVDDGELTIRPKNRLRTDWPRLASATFYITVPRLERVAQAGSGNVRVDRIEGDSFEGAIAGSGELAIDALEVDEAEFSIAGTGSVVVAAGAARETDISIGGRGEVRAAGLRSDVASISIGGVGEVALTVEDEAQVSIMGSGDVDITGPARCSVSRMGGGEVRCNGREVD
jgi:hypothetical protein